MAEGPPPMTHTRSGAILGLIATLEEDLSRPVLVVDLDETLSGECQSMTSVGCIELLDRLSSGQSNSRRKIVTQRSPRNLSSAFATWQIREARKRFKTPV